MPRKADLEEKYSVPVYTQWRHVPEHLHARSWYGKKNIPRDAKPDAIKGGGMICKTIYFLFDERKYLSQERLQEEVIKRRPII